MLISFLRTIILYIVVVFGMRMMGKRQLGQLQPSELVITILISNIATLPIEDTDVPLLGGIVPILTLVCFEVVISCISLKNKRARQFISGTPRMIIREGKIDQQELRNLRFSVDDLMEQLRTNNVFDIRDVDYAIVETTGMLSVYKRFAAQETTAKMMNLQQPAQSTAPPVVVISDGEVIHTSFHHCDITGTWLESTVRGDGYQIEDIFLMTCDKNKDYFIVPKTSKEAKNA